MKSKLAVTEQAKDFDNLFSGHHENILPLKSKITDPFINECKVHISVNMKIYRSKLIHEILNAQSIDEVKWNINENVLKIQKQDTGDYMFAHYISYILEELNDLKGSALATEYYMNLSAAGTYLRHLSLSTQ
jgi:hypothetical protein